MPLWLISGILITLNGLRALHETPSPSPPERRARSCCLLGHTFRVCRVKQIQILYLHSVWLTWWIREPEAGESRGFSATTFGRSDGTEKMWRVSLSLAIWMSSILGLGRWMRLSVTDISWYYSGGGRRERERDMHQCWSWEEIRQAWKWNEEKCVGELDHLKSTNLC